MPSRRHRYAGYSVESVVPLAALPACGGMTCETPQIVVALADLAPRDSRNPHWLHEWRNPDESVSLQLAGMSAPSGYLLRAPKACDFHIDIDAATIEIAPADGLDPHTLEHLLIDQALPRLLSGRGHLMVHASLARIGTQAALFLGRSGWGKSTLAGLLHRRCHPALCDDCVRLELRNGRAWATPSYPGLRLYQDSIDQTFESAPEASPVSGYSNKQRVIGLQLKPEWLEAQPLRAIYLLGNPGHANGTTSITPLTAAEACMAMVEHSFRLDPTDRVQTAQLLRKFAAVATSIPAWNLCYPHDFDRQDEVVRMVLDHFDKTAETL